MVILGGLEIVVGGYLVHRYHKNKNEKRQLQEEAKRQDFEDYRRKHHGHSSKPRPDHYHQHSPAHSGHHGKYAYHAPNAEHQSYYPQQPRPQPPQHYAQQQPEFVPQPVGRQDSFASLNSMPIANGRSQHTLHPPQHTYTHPLPNYLPPHPQQQPLQPGHVQPSYPYYNTAFSASYPSFSPSSTAPAVQHNSTTPPGRQTLDDNMEAYGPQSPHVRFDVSASPQPGERDDDPPPPYRP